jgi:precorrin-6B methylase 2
LFPELRKAARNFPETESLADAPADAEHREKYSMGGGYYLKLGGRHWSGWRVEKQSFYGGDPVKRIPQGDWFTGTPAAAAPAKNGGKPEHVTGDAGALIEEHTHSKHGFTMWLAILPGRVPREEFDRLTGEARALGGWYSRPWGKTPGGFAFKVKASAERFAGATPSAPDPDGAPKRDAERMPSPEAPKVAGDKLRTLADAMQRDIDSAFRDRLTNTPKRQREAQSARLEGLRLQRTQAGMRALADMHDAGTAPPVLANVTTRKAAYELAGAEIKRSGGYYDAGHETGKPSRDTEAARAFWALVAGADDEQRAAFELRQKIEALQFARIPGYFPTPRAVVARMLELAEIEPGALVLEPSAGHGAILDEIKAAHPGARLVAYERHHSLAEIIAAKGYTVDRCDFTEQAPESVYDRVMMNPPFENGQDMQHVRHAFTFLKPGGRLVAVMSLGPFFRQDKAASGFRDWFDDMGGEREDLPAGSFKESGTGVGAVLVTICKGGA